MAHDRCLKVSSPASGEFWEIPVLGEDAALLALAKPAGLPTSPDRLHPTRPNLMALLHEAIKQARPWTRERQLGYLACAHRLDSDTSGALLLVRNKPALIRLANDFGCGQIVRTYQVLVQGSPVEEAFEVETRVDLDPAQSGRARAGSRRGMPALSRFQVLERFSGYTWLQAEVRMERLHQVRVHLRHAGLAVAGDATYGGAPLLLSRLKAGYRLKPNRTERPLLNRPALHASELAVRHPVTGEPVRFSAPLPRDLTVALKYLRRYAGPPAAMAVPGEA